MRVHFISPWYPDYASAYAGIFVQKQVRGLEAAGHLVTVEVPQLFPAPPGPVAEEVVESMRDLARRDVQAMFPTAELVTSVPAPDAGRAGDLGRAESFRDFIGIKRDFIPVETDITHAHLGVPTGWAALQLGDRPLVVTEHQSTLDRIFMNPAATTAYRQTVESADAFLCVSGYLRSQVLAALGGELASKIEVVPNVVDLTDIHFTERADVGCASWIYVGTITAHKGVELLLRAFHRYQAEVDNSAVLTIVGDGPHRGWVERFAAVKALGDAVVLAGQVPHAELGSYLERADVMVHLSPSETFGVASLEGIGAGLPIVSLRNGGADTAWGDIESLCGSLLDVDVDAEAVVSAVVDLRADPERLNPMAGREMVEERFAPEVVTEQLIEIYERFV